jgi:hypothetical protein
VPQGNSPPPDLVDLGNGRAGSRQGQLVPPACGVGTGKHGTRGEQHAQLGGDAVAERSFTPQLDHANLTAAEAISTSEVCGHEDAIRPRGYQCSRDASASGRVARRRVPTDTSVDFDAEALQFAVQRRTGDTEGCCGLHTVLAGLAQCQDDRVSLD